MDNYDWLEKLPPEFIELVQQLLPMPMALSKCIEESRRLEAEVLILSNILIKKGIVTIKEIQTMTDVVLAEKKKEMESKINSKPEILNRKDYMEIKSLLDKLIEKKNNNGTA